MTARKSRNFGDVCRNGAKVLISVLALSALPGCAFMPTTGPQSFDVTSGTSPTLPYALVKLTPETINVLSQIEPKGLAGVFSVPNRTSKPVGIKFGIGDVVSVTVFEAAAGGLFIPTEAGVRPGNFVTLPDQTIDNDGNITVPYAGIIKADGRVNTEIQRDIVAKIANRAIEPQVVVSLSQQKTSLISVIGEVNVPLRFAAPASGALDRVTDAITRAGGIKGQGFETWVMLERKGRRASVPFANLVYEPANNIYVQPGDRIYVYREQQKFIAFGAVGQQSEFNFDAWRINLAEGVAKASGLVDVQADPGSVFLYRREPREVAEQLGVDISKYQGEIIPVIFTISFRDPGGYFLATRLQMRNQDVIFVANAQSVEVTKFLNYLNVMINTGANGAVGFDDVLIARQSFRAATGHP